MKKEIMLVEGNYKKCNELKDLKSIAKQIETLLFLTPGTHPTNNELGIGIEKYIHEFYSSELINELTAAIKSQIKNYINTNLVKDIVIEKTNIKATGLSLVIIITLKEEYDNKQITYVVSTGNNNKVFTETYL